MSYQSYNFNLKDEQFALVKMHKIIFFASAFANAELVLDMSLGWEKGGCPKKINVDKQFNASNFLG